MAEYKRAKDTIIENGVSMPNRFNVIIQIPQRLIDKVNQEPEDSWFSDVKDIIKKVNNSSDTTRTLELSVEATEMPGKNINTTDIKYNGDYYKLPSSIIYGVHPMTLRIGKDMYEKDVIDKWMDLVYNTDSHVINYYDDYVSTITIQQLDRNENVVYSVKLLDAFPTICNPLTYAQNDNNSYNKLQVSFAYRKWKKDIVEKVSGIGSLSQTPLGPIVGPVLSNPAVQKGLQVFEDNTGIDLEGEAVNIYNNIDEVVKSTTGTSVNKNTTVLNKLKFNLDSNTNITDFDKAELGDIVDNVLNAWK